MTWQHISVPLIKVIEGMVKAAENENPKPKRKPRKSKQ